MQFQIDIDGFPNAQRNDQQRIFKRKRNEKNRAENCCDASRSRWCDLLVAEKIRS